MTMMKSGCDLKNMDGVFFIWEDWAKRETGSDMKDHRFKDYETDSNNGEIGNMKQQDGEDNGDGEKKKLEKEGNRRMKAKW